MIQTWRQLPIVVQYSIDQNYHNLYEKKQLFSFCVICRPDFEQLLVILRFSPLLFANISVQMTLKTRLMNLINIIYTNSTPRIF